MDLGLFCKHQLSFRHLFESFLLYLLHSQKISLLHALHSLLKLLFCELRMSFPDFLQNSLLFLFVQVDLYLFGDRLLDLFNRFLFVLDDLRSSFINGFELFFLVQELRGLVLNFKVAKLSHFLFHVDKIAIEQSFFLDEMVQIKLFDSVGADVLFISFVDCLVSTMVRFRFSRSFWWLFGFRLGPRFGLVHVGLLFRVEGVGSFSIDLDEEVFDLDQEERVLFLELIFRVRACYVNMKLYEKR